MVLEDNESNSETSTTMEHSKNNDPLALDAMNKLSLKNDGEKICAVELSANINKSNKENLPPSDHNHINCNGGYATINSNTTSILAKVPLPRGLPGSYPVEIICSDSSVNKSPWRIADQTPNIKFHQQQPTAATLHPTSNFKDESIDHQQKDACNSDSAKSNGIAIVTPPETRSPSDGPSVEEMFSTLTLENESWIRCLQPPNIKVFKEQPAAPPPRAQESDGEDVDDCWVYHDDTDCPVRGPMFTNHMSKQRSTPYRQPPSPWSGSDQTNSPGPSSDLSRSPIYRSDNSQSPTPESIPSVQGGTTVPCIRPLIQNGGSCTVNQIVAHAENSSALSSSSPPSDVESTQKTWKFMAGGTIWSGDASTERRSSSSSTNMVEPIVAISTMEDILSKSPQREATKVLGPNKECEANSVSTVYSASLQSGCWYGYSPSSENSPECDSEVSDDISTVFSSMAPYTSEAVGLDDLDDFLLEENGSKVHVVDREVSADLNGRLGSDGIDNMLNVYDIDTIFDSSIYDAACILDIPSVDTPVTSQKIAVPQNNGNGSIALNHAQIVMPPLYTAFSLSPVQLPLPFEATSCSTRTGVPPTLQMPTDSVIADVSLPFEVPSIKIVVPMPGANVTAAFCSNSPNAVVRHRSTSSAGTGKLPLKPSPSTVESKIEKRLKEFPLILPRPAPGNSLRNMTESSVRGCSSNMQSPPLAAVSIPIRKATSVGTGDHTLNSTSSRTHSTYGDEYLVLTPDKDGDTNLHIAAANNNMDLARAILERKCNHRSCIDVRNKRGQTPLFVAVHSNNAEMVRYLLQNGAEPNPSCADGNTPLHLLAMGRPELHDIGKILFQVPHIPLNTRNSKGFTALHLAVQHHNELTNMTKLIHMLLTNGADLTFTEPCSSKTPLHMAVERGLPELVVLICESCVNISAAINWNGSKGTALHYAALLNNICESDQLAIVTTLLKHGSNPSMRSSYLCNKYPKDLVCKERKKVKDLLKLNRK